MSGVSPNVVVGSDDLVLLDELVRHLEELPHWRLVGVVRSSSEFVSALAEQSPDAALVSDRIALEIASAGGGAGATRLVVLAREERSETLKAAIKIGARGFVLWPHERGQLRALVESGLGAPRSAPRGTLTALWSPKGGSGSSVLAAHLAATLASFGLRSLLLDLDFDNADQTAILGIRGETKTFADLMRVVDELSPAAVESVVFHHPDGFRVALSPGVPGESGLVKASDVLKAIAALRDSADHSLADLPSGYGDLVFALAEEATRLVLVVTPDLLALRRAREAMRGFRAGGIETGKFEVVLNHAYGRDVTASDVEAVIGRPVVAEIPPNLALFKAPGRGEISPVGMRLLDPLARRIAGLPAVATRRLGRVRSRRLS